MSAPRIMVMLYLIKGWGWVADVYCDSLLFFRLDGKQASRAGVESFATSQGWTKAGKWGLRDGDQPFSVCKYDCEGWEDMMQRVDEQYGALGGLSMCDQCTEPACQGEKACQNGV